MKCEKCGKELPLARVGRSRVCESCSLEPVPWMRPEGLSKVVVPARLSLDFLNFPPLASLDQVGLDPTPKDCPACASSAARAKVILEIVSTVQKTGSFQVAGVVNFWKQFRDQLCFSCRMSLDSIQSNREQAVSLLKEAIELDSGNQAARKNLEVARKMV